MPGAPTRVFASSLVAFFVPALASVVRPAASVSRPSPTAFLVTEPTPAGPAEEKASGTITKSAKRQRWWGFPNYLKDLDSGIPTWNEFARQHGNFGNKCTEEDKGKQCGTDFVCKGGTCSECSVSRDCDDQFKCHASPSGLKVCIPRDLIAQWAWNEVLLTTLIILTAVLSAAAGMGGGGVYVPLLLLLGGLSTKEAVPLSQAMIVGGATVNVIMFCGERHPKDPRRPKIDYEVLMMLNPGLAAGVTIGVMAHMISPQWLIVVILIVTLVLALQKSLSKGLQAWQKESEMLALAAHQPSGGGAAASRGSVKIKLADLGSFLQLAGDYQRQCLLIFGCWATFLALNALKAPQCSVVYWLQNLGLMIVCALFTAAGASTIRGQSGEASEALLQWTPTTLWLYPLFSTVAGFLGGFLGIGGGIIMGPLLLELGMVPEANQATTAAFVFLSSSLATIQFMLLGRTMPQYVLWFTMWVVLATFIGQTALDYLLRRYQRSSLIVLSIAGIIAASLIMMTLIGASDIFHDIYRGAYMGFSVNGLCHP